jgi:hypothetical protein
MTEGEKLDIACKSMDSAILAVKNASHWISTVDSNRLSVTENALCSIASCVWRTLALQLENQSYKLKGII